MSTELQILLVTAASIGFVHTLFGPDHYLPFIVLGKARKWSLKKTSFITILCGLGHVGSSIALGFIGVLFGIGVAKLEIFESVRGSLAGWAFIIFGAGYLLWSLYRLKRNKPHCHIHIHSDGQSHSHTHNHHGDHLHGHSKKLTPWVLFIIFVLGPCEPLIPLLMYPAAQNSMGGVALVAGVFALVTVGTMWGVVMFTLYGFNFVKFGRIEKYTHIIAGSTILVSGVGMQFLGL